MKQVLKLTPLKIMICIPKFKLMEYETSIEQGQILTQLRSNRTDTSLRLIRLMFVDKHPQRQKISIFQLYQFFLSHISISYRGIINMNYLFFLNLLWRNFLWQKFPKSKNLMTFLIFTAFIKMFNFMIWWSWKTQWPSKANQSSCEWHVSWHNRDSGPAQIGGVS